VGSGFRSGCVGELVHGESVAMVPRGRNLAEFAALGMRGIREGMKCLAWK
jgi:hypothetical protein